MSVPGRAARMAGITGGTLPLSCVLTTDEIYAAFYADDVARIIDKALETGTFLVAAAITDMGQRFRMLATVVDARGAEPLERVASRLRNAEALLVLGGELRVSPALVHEGQNADETEEAEYVVRDIVKAKQLKDLGEDSDMLDRVVEAIVAAGIEGVNEAITGACVDVSGTEPVVRVYSEARTLDDLEKLSAAASQWIFE